MKIDVKICGLDREETVEAAAEAGVAMIGFVFYHKSPRNLTLSKAPILTSRVPDHVKSVGLFVDPTDREILEVLENNSVDVLQLHGTESNERLVSIKELTGLEVIKAVKISESKDLQFISKYKDVVDWVLFDAPVPSGMKGALPGGNALTLNWDILAGANITFPWILAGGLNQDNVKAAITVSKATFVDISSGVEVKPGVKSVRKIRAFIAALGAI